MEDLDLNIGRRIQGQLCDDCEKKLSDKIKKRHILMATTPWGMKKLFDRIDRFCCDKCRLMILKERFEGETR